MAMQKMSGIIESKTTIGWLNMFRQPVKALSLSVRCQPKDESKGIFDNMDESETFDFIVTKGSKGYDAFSAMCVGSQFDAKVKDAAQNEKTGNLRFSFEAVEENRVTEFVYNKPTVRMEAPKVRVFYEDDMD